MQQCQACGGTYNSLQPDGTEYYHACPPLSSAEILSLIGQGLLVLRNDMAATFAAAEAADAAAVAAGQPATHVSAFLVTLTIERPNKRDENLAPPSADLPPGAIVSEGAGAITLPAAPDLPPIATFTMAKASLP